jgi:hypothetical protein
LLGLGIAVLSRFVLETGADPDGKRTKSPASAEGRDLDALIDRITVDAYGDGEQLWACRQDFEDEVGVPCDAFVVGESVSVIEFDFDGNERRGLTARCRCADGSEYVVSAADVVLPADARGARHLAAYRKWMVLSPHPPEPNAPARGKAWRQTGSAAAPVLDMGASIELVVPSVKQRAARCRLLGGAQTVTLRAKRFWDLVPGEICRSAAEQAMELRRQSLLVRGNRVHADRCGRAWFDSAPVGRPRNLEPER